MASAYDALLAETVLLAGHGGDRIEAYLARPLAPGPFGGVVVIHHAPGYDRATKEIVRRLAAHGYAALCPNLHHRDAAGADPEAAAAVVREAGGVADERVVGDVAAAADHLRGLTSANGSIGVIGFCSGGRQAVLVASSLPLQAAVDCYGAFVVGEPPPGRRARPIVHLTPQLSCPLLGLFGAEDTHPTPAEVAELDGVLTEHGKPHQFHVYEGAGHAFFAVDRPTYRPEAANDGWKQVLDWFGVHLAATPAEGASGSTPPGAPGPAAG